MAGCFSGGGRIFFGSCGGTGVLLMVAVAVLSLAAGFFFEGSGGGVMVFEVVAVLSLGAGFF